jgi:alcohol dehydrogenase (cytochrome c)
VFNVRSSLCLLMLSAACAVAQTGVFTKEQAAKGAEAYQTTCAGCHGRDLAGLGAPALAGPKFTEKWAGDRNALELFGIVRTMPPGGSHMVTLDKQVVILAHLLEKNGHAAGETPLTTDSQKLKTIPVVAKAAAPPTTATSKAAPPAFVAGKGTAVRDNFGPTQAELLDAQNSKRDWLYHNGNYAGTRYSPLDRINANNAKDLRAACVFQVGDIVNFQTGPIVHNGTMYITSQHTTIALDATNCRPKWRHQWQPLGREVWNNNRGVAIKDGRIVRGTSDGYLVQLNAETGELIWARRVAETDTGETLTMSPLLFEDLILIGPAGSENGISGWVGAFKMSDGSPVWRFKTVPGAREPGDPSWSNPKNIVLGGGAVWTPFSLDPQKGELFVAVTNPAPDLPATLRPGDNLYTNSMIALDVRTGKLLWHKQMVANDSHDYDLTQVSPLFKTKINGRESSLVATAGKDGMLRVVDRNSREVVYKTAITTLENADVPVTNKPVHACPGVYGGVEWNGPAYHPGTNMLYVGAVDWCSTFVADDEYQSKDQGKGSFFGGSAKMDKNQQGWITAVDASTGKVSWKYKSPRPIVGAVTATAGNLLLAGELTGDFTVFHAKTGDVLYRFNTGGPIGGGIVTYELGGKQYIAIASGRPSRFWIDQNPGAPTMFIFALP